MSACCQLPAAALQTPPDPQLGAPQHVRQISSVACVPCAASCQAACGAVLCRVRLLVCDVGQHRCAAAASARPCPGPPPPPPSPPHPPTHTHMVCARIGLCAVRRRVLETSADVQLLLNKDEPCACGSGKKSWACCGWKVGRAALDACGAGWQHTHDFPGIVGGATAACRAPSSGCARASCLGRFPSSAAAHRAPLTMVFAVFKGAGRLRPWRCALASLPRV